VKALAWGDELVEKAREIVKKAKAEEAALNQERLEWEKAVIKGDDVGPVRHSPKPNSEKLREPIAFVATGVTKGRGEAYGWQRYALLLGGALGEENCSPNVYKYARRRFQKENLVFEGCKNWSVREVAQWHHWLSDPRRPMIPIEDEPEDESKEITR